MPMTARQLRNRVLTILDQDDSMEPSKVEEEDVAYSMSTFAPAIKYTTGGETYLIVFQEVEQ